MENRKDPFVVYCEEVTWNRKWKLEQWLITAWRDQDRIWKDDPVDKWRFRFVILFVVLLAYGELVMINFIIAGKLWN